MSLHDKYACPTCNVVHQSFNCARAILEWPERELIFRTDPGVYSSDARVFSDLMDMTFIADDLAGFRALIYQADRRRKRSEEWLCYSQYRPLWRMGFTTNSVAE